jgi:hypothetical protein
MSEVPCRWACRRSEVPCRWACRCQKYHVDGAVEGQKYHVDGPVDGQKYHVDGPVDGVFNSQKEKRLLERVNKIRPCKKPPMSDHSLQIVA